MNEWAFLLCHNQHFHVASQTAVVYIGRVICSDGHSRWIVHQVNPCRVHTRWNIYWEYDIVNLKELNRAASFLEHHAWVPGWSCFLQVHITLTLTLTLTAIHCVSFSNLQLFPLSLGLKILSTLISETHSLMYFS